MFVCYGLVAKTLKSSGSVVESLIFRNMDLVKAMMGFLFK